MKSKTAAGAVGLLLLLVCMLKNFFQKFQINRGIVFILTIIVVVSGVGTGLWSLEKSGFFNILNLEVKIVNPLPGQLILQQDFRNEVLPKVQTLKGQSLFRMRLSPIVSQLRQMPWLKSFRIRREWPKTVTVELETFEVKFMSMSGPEKTKPILENGAVLESISLSHAPDVPFVDAQILNRKDIREKALKMVGELPENGSFQFKKISNLFYSSKNGFEANLVGQSGMVFLGEDQFAIKGQRISKVLEYLQQKRYDAQVIDANLSKKVLVRLRKDP